MESKEFNTSPHIDLRSAENYEYEKKGSSSICGGLQHGLRSVLVNAQLCSIYIEHSLSLQSENNSIVRFDQLTDLCPSFVKQNQISSFFFFISSSQ